jgi:putative hydrolase of the HAD superfamily
MIRTVVFDLGNVLLPFDSRRAADAFCARAQCSRRQLQDYFLTTSFVQQFESGQMTGPEFYRRLATDFTFAGSYDDFCLAWSDIFTTDDAMWALAAELKGQLPRYLLSNTNEIHYRFIIEEFPQVADLDGQVLSYEIGVMKPDRRIYEAAVAKFNLDPATTVFIDDLPANIEGARAAGWQGIIHRSARQTRAELTKLGVVGI